jgi:hypothetical protein
LDNEHLVLLLHKNYAGDPWHGPSLKAVLEGVDAKTAMARPADAIHTIWELVLHLNSWYREVERRLKGAPAAEPVEGDWPQMSDGSEIEWARALAALADAKDAFVRAAQAFPPGGWDDPVSDTRDPALGSGVSYFEMVEGVLQHTAYHAGQIRLLRTIISGK